MNKRLIVALACGLAAGVAHFFFLRSVEADASGGEPVEVLAAATEIEKGEAATEERMGVTSIPRRLYDGRAVPASRAAEVAGLAVGVKVERGQRLHWSDFQARDDGGGRDLASLIGPGQRAMTIPVDSSLAMGGMLQPGHRVDIIGTFSKGRDLRKDKVTVTLLQNVTVLATGDETAGDEGDDGGARFTTATLSVGLEESELLAFAASTGRLALVLRGFQDLEIMRDVPEKGMNDVWEAERRNSLQKKGRGAPAAIERLKAR